MNLEYRSLLDPSFDDSSRVWIYQSPRLFSLSEALQIETLLDEFVGQWKTHGTPVKGAAHLFFGLFIILLADETATGVSGCSTDSSVRLIKDIEQTFRVQLFDRTMLAFVLQDKVQLLPMAQLTYSFNNGFISADTLYFNNTILTRKELMERWIVPVSASWLNRKLPAATT